MGDELTRLLAVAFAIAASVLLARVAYVTYLVLTAVPRGRRWSGFLAGLRIVGRSVWIDPAATAAQRVPEELRTMPTARREVELDSSPRIGPEWFAPRLVAHAHEGLALVGIDGDGSVLLLGKASPAAPHGTLVVAAPDGTRRDVALRAPTEAGVVRTAAIGDGVVAWATYDAGRRHFAVYRERPGEPSELVHGGVVPGGLTTSGWSGVAVAGGVVVTAVPAGDRWTLRAVGEPGEGVDLATLQVPTLNRDLVAARHGAQLVSACVSVPGSPAIQDTAIVDVAEWPPRLSVVRRGAFLGATTAGGELVGFWRNERVLSLPGGTAVRMDERVTVVDPVCSGDWVAFTEFRSIPPMTTLVHSAVAIHVPSGSVAVLSASGAGRLFLAGSTVAWVDKAPADKSPVENAQGGAGRSAGPTYGDVWVGRCPEFASAGGDEA